MYLNLHEKIIIPFFFYSLIISFFIYSYKPNIKEHNIDSTPLTLPQLPSKNDYSVISSWPLFGLNAGDTISKITDNRIKLVGIIYRAQSSNKSSAVIFMDNKEYILHNGDKIGNAYIIHKIEPSRIIVTSKNGLEELALFAT